MSITIELAPEVQAELVRQAAKRGVRVDEYVAILIGSAARISQSSQSSAPSREVVEAVETLRSFGKAQRLSLGGMTIQELRHEARP